MQDDKEQQYFFMLHCLRLGEKGRFTAPPNPWVGSLVAKEGKIVGEGYHKFPGTPHAEVVALKEAGSKASGATLYISLEPCAHHGLTPPCVDAIVKAGVAHVVIPFLDPDPKVSGKGVALLEKAGIQVTLGVAEKEAYAQLEPYLVHRKTKKPFVHLKIASSMDGKISAHDGSSKWITNVTSRLDAHKIRASSQAILIGANTALIDQPSLTVRHPEIELRNSPLRVILDGKGRVPAVGPLFDQAQAPTLIFTTNGCDPKRLEEWKSKGVEIAVVSGENIDLNEVLESLGKRGVLQVLVEGGASVYSSFIKERLIDKCSLYLAPCLLGNRALSFFSRGNFTSMTETLRWSFESATPFDGDLRIDYRPT